MVKPFSFNQAKGQIENICMAKRRRLGRSKDIEEDTAWGPRNEINTR